MIILVIPGSTLPGHYDHLNTPLYCFQTAALLPEFIRLAITYFHYYYGKSLLFQYGVFQVKKKCKLIHVISALNSNFPFRSASFYVLYRNLITFVNCCIPYKSNSIYVSRFYAVMLRGSQSL